MPAIEVKIAINIPRLCNLSEANKKVTRTRVATA